MRDPFEKWPLRSHSPPTPSPVQPVEESGQGDAGKDWTDLRARIVAEFSSLRSNDMNPTAKVDQCERAILTLIDCAALRSRAPEGGSEPASEGVAPGWLPIETAPRGTLVVLYHPPTTGRHGQVKLSEWVSVNVYPPGYPRKASHWMPLPAPPATSESGK